MATSTSRSRASVEKKPVARSNKPVPKRGKPIYIKGAAPAKAPTSNHINVGQHITISPIAGLTPKAVLRATWRFQHAPLESLRREISYAHSEYEAIDRIQRSRRQAKQLDVVSFQTMFTSATMPFLSMTNSEVDIHDHVGVLERVNDSGRPVRLTIRNAQGGYSKADVDMVCTLRTCSVEEKAGEPDTRYVNLSFHEYPHPLPQKVTNVDPYKKTWGGGKDDLVLRTASEALIYTLTPSDTLRKVARRFYGDPSGWSVILKWNQLIKAIGPDDKIKTKYPRLKTINVPQWGGATPREVVVSVSYPKGPNGGFVAMPVRVPAVGSGGFEPLD